MNRYQKLESAINEVLKTNFKEDEDFMVQEIAPKLQSVINLMTFEGLNNAEFNNYLDLFRNDVFIDITRCHHDANTIAPGERHELLEAIKMRVKAKLAIVEFAFAYYLKDRTILYRDESTLTVNLVDHVSTNFPDPINYSNKR